MNGCCGFRLAFSQELDAFIYLYLYTERDCHGELPYDIYLDLLSVIVIVERCCWIKLSNYLTFPSQTMAIYYYFLVIL